MTTTSIDGLPEVGPQIIFGMDTQGCCTFSVGPGLAGQGILPGQLVGINMKSLYTDPYDVAMLHRALAGESFTAQNTVHGRLLRTRFEPVHDANGEFEGVVGVSTDMTDYVKTQEELSRFKALADDSPTYIAIADQDGKLTYVNPQLAALDLPLADGNLHQAVTELAGSELANELQSRLVSGSRWSGDTTLPLPASDMVLSGQLFPLYDSTGTHRLGAGWIAQDITDLRNAEGALRASHADLEQFRALVDASSDFIAIAGLDGSIRYLNPAGRQLVEMSLDLDVTATTIEDYLTPEGFELSKRIEQPAVMEHGRWQGESTLKKANGSSVPVEISSFLIPDPHTGAPSALATVQRDIEERLAASQAQEEFVALVAHELRTPLASVKGYVEIASESLESHPDPVQLAAHLKVATRNIVRIERLVEQILRVAGENRRRPEELARLDFVGIVEQAVESARPGVESAGLRFHFEACPPLILHLDETFVEVVDNLVSNAAKYTPAGGEITVTVARDHNVAELTVTDTGPGIPASDRATIFDKFVRGNLAKHQSIPGLGLGLYLTRAIVVAHQGEIAVYEGPSGGTRFVVRLPVPPEDHSTV